MKPLTEELYKKLTVLGRNVKQQLRQKGFVVPVKNSNGSISFDKFTVIHKSNGFYTILDSHQDPVIDQINLPQTAVILANNLALGKYKDDKLIKNDQYYGYAEFEKQVYKRALMRKGTSLMHFDVSQSKYSTAHEKRELYKKTIMASFEKLTKLI
jgi:hypothetical protein